MRFPHQVLTGLEDAQANFEYLEAGSRSGTGTFTWPGGQAASGTVTIQHGLGRVPSQITILCVGTGVTGQLVSVPSLSQFQVAGFNGSVFGSPLAGATAQFYWTAQA